MIRSRSCSVEFGQSISEEEKIDERDHTEALQKPVMLGMAFLIGAALLVIVRHNGKKQAAQSGFPIVAVTTNSRPLATANLSTTSGVHRYPRTSSDQVPTIQPTRAMEGVPLSAGSDIDTSSSGTKLSQGQAAAQLTMTGLSHEQ
jgi:hypothetical protein